MTIAAWCLLVAFLLAYIPRGPAIRGAMKMDGRYDIDDPRGQQARLSGKPARAQAAHQNMLEAFAPFAAGVLLNHILPTDPAWRDGLALLFIAARIVYYPAYLHGWGYGRSLVWAVGVAAVIGLLVLPAFV